MVYTKGTKMREGDGTMTTATTKFTIQDLFALGNNDGATLRHGKAISYKTGYQVATDGVAYDNALAALAQYAVLKGIVEYGLRMVCIT